MRLGLVILLLVPVWALAPWFGSPASLWVMPLVAAIATILSGTTRRALIASLASLAILCLPFLAMGVALFAFHAPFVALLAWGMGSARAWWTKRGATVSA